MSSAKFATSLPPRGYFPLSQAPFVAIPRTQLGSAQAPEDPDRRRAPAPGETAVLAAGVVEAAETDAVREIVGAQVRAIDQVMVLEIAARRAGGGGAAPAVADVDGIAVPSRRRRSGGSAPDTCRGTLARL